MQKKVIVLIIMWAVLNICGTKSWAEGVTPVPSRSETSGAVINQQLQTIKQVEPEVSTNNVVIKNEYQPDIPSEGGIKVVLREIKFSGDRLLSEQALQMVSGRYLNKEIALADLNKLCKEINGILSENDYAVAIAYVPQQDIIEGVATIMIVGGRYGSIKINNSSDVPDRLIKMEMVGIKSGDFIRTSSLERATLLINDLSGVSAKAMLSAGSKAGESDLIIEIKNSGEKLKWQLTYDNYGSYNIGPDEVGVTAYGRNLMNRGDNLYLRLNSGGVGGVSVESDKGLLLGAVNWENPIGADGGKISMGYSQMNYTLGRGFSGLNYTGQANVANINWTKPLVRSRMKNLSFSLGYDNAQLLNGYPAPIGAANQTVNRFNLALNGDMADKNGMNIFNITWTNGRAGMDSVASQLFSDRIAHTSGQYNKFSYSLMRQQRLAARWLMILKVNGQWSDKNLVSFEDISLGGPNGVRAYGIGEGSGDEGYVGTAEIRWMVPGSDSLQLLAFYDIGGVVINKNTWPFFQGNNSINLSGYGLGLIWNRPDLYSVNLSYAWRESNNISTVGDYPQTDGRLWLSMSISI